MQREKVSVKSKGKFDVEKIRDFTYKIEEYERQRKRFYLFMKKLKSKKIIRPPYLFMVEVLVI